MLSNEYSKRAVLSVLNSTFAPVLRSVEYISRKYLSVSLLLLCLALGQGSEKLRYILDTSPDSNISFNIEASIQA